MRMREQADEGEEQAVDEIGDRDRGEEDRECLPSSSSSERIGC
jgi:hypothetical protein